jgi:hypothetical protein
MIALVAFVVIWARVEGNQNETASLHHYFSSNPNSPSQENIEAHAKAMQECEEKFREAGYGGDLTSTCEETVDKFLPRWRQAVSH